MTESKNNIPPRWATRFLQWYCKPSILEDLEGDLSEFYYRNLKEKGRRRARLIYVIDVFKFFRHYTIRTPKFSNSLINSLMLGSYIKTSARNIRRHKLFSTINIIGLAVSMSVGLLLIAFIADLKTYDSFLNKKGRIYRIVTDAQYGDSRASNFATTSFRAGNAIRESVPGIEYLTIIRTGFGFGGDIEYGQTKVPMHGIYADDSFFMVLSFSMLEGNPATALKEPNSLVLTESNAKKLFGEKDGMGQVVRLDTTDYKVTGIMQDVPKTSHMKFGVIASLSTFENSLKTNEYAKSIMSWAAIYSNFVYLTLPEKADPKSIQSAIDQISKHENDPASNLQIALSLEPVSAIPFDPPRGNAMKQTIGETTLWILLGLVIVIIFSACVNYTNLSIARALRRSREVGIRKISGALRGHVFAQFIVESVTISVLALVLSFGIFFLLRSSFLSLQYNYVLMGDLVSLKPSAIVIFWFVVFSLAVGIIAGLIPALFFSRMNAMRVLKDSSGVKIFRYIMPRKALVVVQYIFSLIFITATIVGIRQYRSFLAMDLGFTTENVLNINLQGNKSDILINELNALPAVTRVSRSMIITNVGTMYSNDVKLPGGESKNVYFNNVDENYIPVLGFELISGTNFNPAADNKHNIIVNQTLLKEFDIAGGNPESAIGELLPTTENAIIGVLKDFHYGTAESKIEPVSLSFTHNEPNGYLNVKIATSDLTGTMAAIKSVWEKVDNHVHDLDATFYNDQIKSAYAEFSVMVKVVGFLGFLAISISTLGLFGMVVFATETRLKEISIRKVLGAGEGSLIYMMSRGFFVLLLVAAAIAIPATWMLFDRVILIDYVYHEPMGIWEYIVGFLGVMVLAIFMIGSQTFKVARTNPAEVLKSE